MAMVQMDKMGVNRVHTREGNSRRDVYTVRPGEELSILSDINVGHL